MIEKSSIRKCNSEDLPDNVIGGAVLIENGEIPHAGIIIRYNGTSKLFHFDGKQVLLEEFNNEEVYLFNEFNFIDARLAASFLAHCEIVQKEAKPVFGFFYIGSQYDEQGKYRSPGELPEYMTCVGFCLNYLKYFHQGNDLFSFEEWGVDSLERSEEYVNRFIEKVKQQHPDIDTNSFGKGIRRIWPIEYISSTFSPNLPVGKPFIDSIKDAVKKILVEQARA